jgi:hypothetical protein
MKKSKFTESQIIGILKQQESGKTVTEICRVYSGQTLPVIPAQTRPLF